MSGVIERHRLLRRLNSSLGAGHVLITAPSGYGKTVLLRSLINHRPNTHYLPLTPADADLPHLRERCVSVLEAHDTVILDDVHHLTDSSEALEWLASFLGDYPPHLVLSGQRELDLNLTIPYTEGRITSLTAGDLAFTLDESKALSTVRYADQANLLEMWHQRLEGWPLGMSLLTRMPVTDDPLPATEKHLFGYLAETVFKGLPPDLHRFMRLTALPLRYNDELAVALLGDGDDATALRQEIQRRNLFVESTEPPGWFRYHELIREFLLQTATTDLTPLFLRVVGWFEEQDDPEMAIENALAGNLPEQAARLILQLPPEFTKIQGRVFTFRRWVLSLSDEDLAANPELLFRLVSTVHGTGRWADAWTHLERLMYLTKAAGDPALRHKTMLAMGMVYFQEEKYEEGLSVMGQILDDPACEDAIRADVYKTMGETLVGLGRLREAGHQYQRAIKLAESLGNEALAMYARHNLIVLVLTPIGAYETARKLMERNAAYVKKSRPYEFGAYLMEGCELHLSMGDWNALERYLTELEAVADQLEEKIDDDILWLRVYRGFLQIGRGNFSQAQRALDQAKELAGDDPLNSIWTGWGQAWLCRRQGRLEDAVGHAEAALARPVAWPAYRAGLALERDIARGAEETPLHPETRNLIQMRARSQLVRLRALLALRARRQGDRRWRRHLQAALHALKRPDYQYLLTHRDPDLGAQFWALALAEGVAIDQATTALNLIGDPEPVFPLLQHVKPVTRARAAQTLAALGSESAMPPLTAALAVERDQETKTALEAALTHLENLPPPPLKILLMGEFTLRRGDGLVPAGAWPRPIVRRLFQYFALHRGKPLPRDRILEDLWPDTTPQKGSSTFRTVYSRLRRVLEPYMRPKGPARYFSVEGNVYRFDPHDMVQVDVETFESLLRGTLKSIQEHDVPPLEETLLAALEGWSPLLPELPYEDWLLEARQRLHDFYVEGCLYVSRAILARGRPAEAGTWAERSVTAAPWLEEGYQALMRAHAQQGQRSLALKVYNDAVSALARELDVEPSPLTRWLAERLRRGEEI